MEAKEDGESVSQEGDQRIMDLALQAVYKEQAKENGDSAKVKFGMRQAAKVGRMEERIRGRMAAARKEEKDKKRVAKENSEHVGRAARQDTLQLGVEKEETKNYTPLTKTTVRTMKNRPKMRRICKHGAFCKKVITNSGKR